MEVSILAVICFERDSFGVRIGLDSTVCYLKNVICEKWISLTPLSIALYFCRDNKKNVIETDLELQSLACFAHAKGEPSTDIFVSLVQHQGSTSASVQSEESSSISQCLRIFDGSIEKKQPLKSDEWASYKWDFEKNDKQRVTVSCKNRKEFGCPWRVHASYKLNIPSKFMIKKMVPDHTCGVGLLDLKKPPLTSKLVKELILKDVRDKPSIKPLEIVNMFKREYGFETPYYYAHAGKELAQKEVFGDVGRSYDHLLWYIDALKNTNPGSHVVLDVDPVTKNFKRFFVAFDACIQAFNSCRPLVFLDATFLKAKYKGHLMAATGKNANDGFFPFAMAIVSSEDAENWDWFLDNLKLILSPARRLTFLSDRNLGLMSSVPKAFPQDFHGYCLWHLKCNLRKNLSGKNPRNKYIETLFDKCAYVATHSDFKRAYDDLVRVGGYKVKKFVDNVPFEHWVNAYFGGERYGEMCFNVAESFNSWISNERHIPVTSMLDQIRLKMMKMMSERREDSRTWTSYLCLKIELLLVNKIKAGWIWRVSKSSDSVFEVHSSGSHIVDLGCMSCSCYLWKVYGFPCEHAICAIQSVRGDVYRFIDRYFTVEAFENTYVHSIKPVPNFDMPSESNEDAEINPPNNPRQPGRPCTKRKENTGAAIEETKALWSV
ncbi:zinc finger protein [Macleaya cordata]|uniref:Zinc finger protein n=1 Tax=Macleaya cordata TaxID=56857 RepID=A0A200PTK1_MACCD|nr:zinc finger protein [Macleaya cordata]